MLKNTILTAALGVALSTGGAFASTVWIDMFDDPAGSAQKVDTEVADPDQNNMTGLADVIGGQRYMDIGSTNGGGYQDKGATTLAGGQSGQLEYSNDAGVISSSTLSWDADGAGLGGIDLTMGGVNDVLKLAGTISDADIEIKFTLYDTNGGMSMLLAVTNDFNVPTDFLVSFADAMGDADLTSIDKITMKMSSDTVSADLTADSLSAMKVVPLPASALLLLGALGGLRLVRRKS